MALAICAQAKLASTNPVTIPKVQKSARLCCSVKPMTHPPSDWRLWTDLRDGRTESKDSRLHLKRRSGREPPRLKMVRT